MNGLIVDNFAVGVKDDCRRDTASANDLYKTSDTIEDYGEHFYFVFGCTQEWRDKNNNG